MSLKTKFSLLLATIFVGLLLVNVSTLSWVVYPAFKELETREAKKNVARVLDILKSDIEGLDLFTYDWAAWDDTYLFIEDKNQAYVKDNFQADYSAEQNHDLYYYWNAKGKPVFHKALSEDNSEYVPFDDFSAEGLPTNHPFLTLNTLTSKSSGLMQTKRGPMIIAARPIIPSDMVGAIRGILAIGRYLDKEVIEKIIQRSHLKLDIWSLTGNQIEDIPKDAPRNIKAGERNFVHSEDGNNIFAYASYPDIFGDPIILLRVSMPRDIVNQGKSTISYGAGMALISGLVILIILLTILQRSIISPLFSLGKNIVRLGKRENVSHELPVERSDELGIVARSVLAGDMERNKAEFARDCQNHVLDKLLKDDLLEEIFNGLLGLIEKQNPEMKCSILIFDPGENKLFALSAPGLPKEYLESVKEIPVGPAAGSCGTAVYKKETVVVADIASDPLWVNYKTIALSHGLKACWSMPIWGVGDNILGTFAIYYSEPRPPSQEELDLGNSLVSLAALAIDRKQVQQELEQYQRNLEGLIKHRTSELQTANANLVEEIKERIKTEDKLNVSLGEKDVLLQEVNHRTKNNMQVISSLIHMQTRKIKDEKYLKLFQESCERINSISLIQDKIFTSKNLQKIDAYKYFNSLVSELLVAYPLDKNQNISFEIETHKIALDVDTGINCGLIVNELVSNSLKHAFQGTTGGEITLNLSSNNQGQYELVVRDNGAGIPKEVNLSNPQTTGMKLITQLGKRNLEGDIVWEQIPGTEFKITFFSMSNN